MADSGQTVGIIGGTGSGKTTLINLICRFYDAAEGEIFVDGNTVKSYDLSELRKKIGIVPQGAALFRGTVRSNICFGKDEASDEEIWEALEAAQARNFVEQKPGGLDFQIEQGGKNLSGGQRQNDLLLQEHLSESPEFLFLMTARLLLIMRRILLCVMP